MSIFFPPKLTLLWGEDGGSSGIGGGDDYDSSDVGNIILVNGPCSNNSGGIIVSNSGVVMT